MAKKNKESADDIIDSLAKDVGASGGDKDGGTSKSAGKAENRGKPGADAHLNTMSQMLMDQGGEQREDMGILLEKFADPTARARGAANLAVFLLLAAAVGGGFFFLQKLSSADAREDRRQKKLAAEETHMAEQLAKLKRFGNVHIESNPPGAVVIQDNDPTKCMNENLATHEKEPCLTPLDISNLDISQTYDFAIQMPNYAGVSFKVAEHLWAKQPGSDDFIYSQTIDLTPNACEYWFLYDGKLKKEVQFKGATGQPDCKKYKEEATKKASTVTDCTCKVLPPGAPSAPAAPSKK